MGSERVAPGRDDRSSAGADAAVPVRRSGEVVRRPLAVRAKLVVGGAGDPAEAEADRIAETVVRRIGSGSPPVRVDEVAPRIRRAGPIGAVQPGESMSAAGGALDAESEQRIRRSTGAPFVGEVRRTMESAFGADFSGVRIHVGSESDSLNHQLGARAFTSGSDVFVRRQDYSPATAGGQRLLAHELAHTLQSGATVARAVDDQPKPAEAEPAMEAGPGEVVFVLDPVEADGYTVGAELFQEDATGSATERSPRFRNAVAARGSAPGALRWESAITTSSSIARDDSTVGKAGDYFKLKEATLNPTTSEVGGASAFGEMTPGYTFTGLEVAYSKKEGRLRVKGSVDGSYKWGTSAGGKIDVPSATDAVVTADNYEQIVADLTPQLEEKSWRAPRSQYWSQAICARHEKYHAKDEEKWFLKNGRVIIDKFLKANQITISDEDRKDLAKVKALAQTAMADTIAHLDKESWKFYAGVGTTYCTRPGEIRAFGDGKAPYQKLAAGVKAQGKKLAKAKAANAKADKKAADKAAATTAAPSGTNPGASGPTT